MSWPAAAGRISICRPTCARSCAYRQQHNVLNISRARPRRRRASMARFGFSPPTRVFEAAGAGACLITDLWPGIELFLKPGLEILIAADGDQVVEHLRAFSLTAPAAWARRRDPARSHLCGPCPAGRGGLGRALGADIGRRGMRPARSSSSGCRSRRPGATQPPDLSRAGQGLARRGHRILFLERDCPGMRLAATTAEIAVRDDAPLSRPRRAAGLVSPARSRRPIWSCSAPTCPKASRSPVGCCRWQRGCGRSTTSTRR